MSSAAPARPNRGEPSSEPVKLPGEVITFYSYKGGTGRTMALANVGCLLAENYPGEGVLMVDWDLEAPGLHTYFAPNCTIPPAPSWWRREGTKGGAPGLLDFFVEADRLAQKMDLSDPAVSVAAAERLLNELAPETLVWHVRLPNSGATHSKLHLLPAGSMGPGYGKTVSRFDWERFYRKMPLFFQLLAERLAFHFRYVLIDSRTGVTDTSSICTAIMPQKLVVVFTPNRQSLTGIQDLVRKAVAHRRKTPDEVRPLTVFPLPSRIEMDRPPLLRSWRFGEKDRGIEGYDPLFRELMTEVYSPEASELGEYFDDVKIQQVRDYAYGERIAVLDEKEIGTDRWSLTYAYRTFTDRLVNRSAPWAKAGVDGKAIWPIIAPQQSRRAKLREWTRKYTRLISEVILMVILMVTAAVGWTNWRNAAAALHNETEMLSVANAAVIALNKDLRKSAGIEQERQKFREVLDAKDMALDAALKEANAKRETLTNLMNEAASLRSSLTEAQDSFKKAQETALDAQQQLQQLLLVTSESAKPTVATGAVAKKEGYIWVGIWDREQNYWPLVNLSPAGSDLAITKNPEEIGPGEQFDVRAFMNLRDGLPEESGSIRARRVLGVVPERGTVEIMHSPEIIHRLDRDQVWVQVKVLPKQMRPAGAGHGR